MTPATLNKRLALALGWKRRHDFWYAPGKPGDGFIHPRDYLSGDGMLAVLEALRERGMEQDIRLDRMPLMQPGESVADYGARIEAWRSESRARSEAENAYRWMRLVDIESDGVPALDSLRMGLTLDAEEAADLVRYVDALVAGGRELLEEYNDRASQFGLHSDGSADYLWDKHEDRDVIERAKLLFEPTPAAPSPAPEE